MNSKIFLTTLLMISADPLQTGFLVTTQGSSADTEMKLPDVDLMTETQALLRRGNLEIKLEPGRRDVTLLLGLSGSGKSTMSQLISGDEEALIAYESGRFDTLIKDSKKNNTLKSQTLFPDLMVDKETDETLYDCPGFQDTRTTPIEIANGFFMKKLVGHAKKIKLLVVAKYDALKIGGSRAWFPNLMIQLFSFVKSFKNYKGGIALLATKVGVAEDEIKERIADFLVAAKEHVLEKLPGREEDVQILYDAWLTQDAEENFINIEYFMQPKLDKRTTEQLLRRIPEVNVNRDRIRQMIFNNTYFQHQPCNPSDFGTPLSDKAVSQIQKIEIKIRSDLNDERLKLAASIRQQLGRYQAGSSVPLPEDLDTYIKAAEQILQANDQVKQINSTTNENATGSVPDILVEMGKSLGLSGVEESTNNLSSNLQFLQDLEYLQPAIGTNKTVDFVQQLKSIIPQAVDITFMREELNARKIPDAVVQKVLLGQPAAAVSFFKKLIATGDILTELIDKAFKSDLSYEITEKIQAVLNFLLLLEAEPQLALCGALHLINRIVESKTWPFPYQPLNQFQHHLQKSTHCPSIAVQLNLYSVWLELQTARQSYVTATAKRIQSGNYLDSKNFFIKELGYNESEAVASVVSEAYNLTRTGSLLDSVSGIIRFLELLNFKQYSTAGLRQLHNTLKSNGQLLSPAIFKLEAHYQSMRLSDPNLASDLKNAINGIYTHWATHVMRNCGKVRAIAAEHGSNFNAFQVFCRGFSGDHSDAVSVTYCIERLPTEMQNLLGYKGLFQKLYDLGLVDSYKYMDLVERFRKNTASIRMRHPKTSDDTLTAIPRAIRNLFFSSGSCSIVSTTQNQCIGVKGSVYYKAFYNYRYDSYLTSPASTVDCRIRLSPRSGSTVEFMIVSARTDSFFYVSKQWGSCESDCRRTFFWGYTQKDSSDFNAWFKVKPYGQGTKFTIMNTYYPGVLAATSKEVVSYAKTSVDEQTSTPRDFWYINC